VALDELTEDSQTAPHPLLSSEAKQRETALAEIKEKSFDAQALRALSLHGTKPHETILLGSTPSTPVRHSGKGF
jgi:hypothetical protein